MGGVNISSIVSVVWLLVGTEAPEVAEWTTHARTKIEAKWWSKSKATVKFEVVLSSYFAFFCYFNYFKKMYLCFPE